ncbi:MAG: restriction endonuclease subunit S [Candidatus Thiodiazotropha sp. (ex. Lucinisca nassula)]|nr:restriction endonuclease subunit S [Candidatus Thiodiazotropha sp. (ex. Lucinisca nassula)]MBW9273066.1 restriction endonuclease subunit S [Candidatus Thiodiazotropha sp. (ex. Lucinisca nassula)]
MTDRHLSKITDRISSLPSGWKIKPISAVMSIGKGQVSPIDVEYSGLLHVGPDNIESGTGRLISPKKAKDLGLVSGKYLFDEEAIVYSKIRPNLNKVVKPGFKGLCSADAYPMWPKSGISRDYIFQFMLSELFVRQAVAVSMRTGMPKINREDLNVVWIICPPVIEQERISEKLATWDRAISLTEQLIAAKLEYRKGLMQQLLSEKLRFPWSSEPWKNRTLGELLDPVSRPCPKPTNTYKALSIRSHFKGTFERVVDDPDTVEMDELYIARSGDLIVNITFAWEGAVAIVPEEHDGLLVSHRFPTFRVRPTDIDLDFLRYVIVQPLFKHHLVIISPGGAGRNRVLNKKDFLKLELRVPELEEQKRIGKILSVADNEITLLRQQLTALKEQKKGLMQQLLTGKKRVKVSEEAT